MIAWHLRPETAAPIRRLQRAAAALRATGDPELIATAAAFDLYLHAGGDLPRLLGVKARRGKRNEVPHNIVRRQRLRVAFRRLAAAHGVEDDDPAQIARAVVQALQKQPALVKVIRDETGAVRVPQSHKGIATLLRDVES